MKTISITSRSWISEGRIDGHLEQIRRRGNHGGTGLDDAIEQTVGRRE